MENNNSENSFLDRFSIKEKVNFYFLFHNSIAFRDFFLPKILRPDYKSRYYQYAPALCDELVWGGARTIGKSLDMNITIINKAIIHSNKESLVSAYRKTHIKDRLEDVISYMDADKFLKKFFKTESNTSLKEAISRSPIYTIKLKNGHVISGISVGDDVNCIAIQGHHPQIRYIEETQSYPRHAWVKFQNTQAQEGSIDRYYGVPDGRIDTPFREMDTTIGKFKNKRFHISRRLDPNFTQEKKNQYIQTLGEDSNEFKSQVDAEWGERAWGVWNDQDILDCFLRNAEGDYIKRLQKIDVFRKDYKSPAESLYMLRSLPENGLDVILAIDTGYSEPTVILPFFYWKNKWNLETIISLKDRIIPDDQAEIIDYIADFYKASLISIDCTSADGRAPATSLCNPKRIEFANKNYEKRVVMVEFTKTDLIGYQKPDNLEKQLIEITEKVKNHTTNILRTKFSNKDFCLSYDEDILLDFNSESQKKDSERTIIVTPRDVHIPEAFRCFAYAYWKAYEKVEKPSEEEYEEDYELAFPVYYNPNFNLFGRE